MVSTERLPFFIETHPDELWYSVVGRLHRRHGTAWHSFRHLLYGRDVTPGSPTLPTDFGQVAARLPQYLKITPEILIEQHTLLPLYRPFLADKTAELWLKQMIGSGKGISLRCAGGVGRVYKFCPECAEEDTDLGVEPYWRRSHQAPMVIVCHKHEAVLRITERLGHRQTALRINEAPSMKCFSNAKPHIQAFVKYAKLCHDILNPEFPLTNLNELLSSYSLALWKRSRTSRDKLIKASQDFLQTEAYSAFVGSGLETLPRSWMNRILVAKGGTHGPLRHYFLCEATKLDLAKLLRSTPPSQTKPFNRNSWIRTRHADFDRELAASVSGIMKGAEAPKHMGHITSAWWMKQLKIPRHSDLKKLPLTFGAIRATNLSRWLTWIADHAPLRSVRKLKSLADVGTQMKRFRIIINPDNLAAAEIAWDALRKRREQKSSR